jgi:hypothetical protein
VPQFKVNLTKSSKEILDLVLPKTIRKKKTRNPFLSAEPFSVFVQKLAAKEQEREEERETK